MQPSNLIRILAFLATIPVLQQDASDFEAWLNLRYYKTNQNELDLIWNTEIWIING